MRTLSLLLVSFCTGFAPTTAAMAHPPKGSQDSGKTSAKKPPKPAKPPKGKPANPGKPKQPGKGHGKGGKPGKGGGDGETAVVATLVGAGQRLHFSFGGDLTLREGGELSGDFIVTAAPIAPAGAVLTFTCHFRDFSDVTLEPIEMRFTGRAKCTRLSTTGAVTTFDAVNEFRIVDNAQADVIELKMVGTTGFSIPAALLDYGNFNLTRPTS
jgi:hypothetical protein